MNDKNFFEQSTTKHTSQVKVTDVNDIPKVSPDMPGCMNPFAGKDQSIIDDILGHASEEAAQYDLEVHTKMLQYDMQKNRELANMQTLGGVHIAGRYRTPEFAEYMIGDKVVTAPEMLAALLDKLPSFDAITVHLDHKLETEFPKDSKVRLSLTPEDGLLGKGAVERLTLASDTKSVSFDVCNRAEFYANNEVIENPEIVAVRAEYLPHTFVFNDRLSASFLVRATKIVFDTAPKRTIINEAMLGYDVQSFLVYFGDVSIRMSMVKYDWVSHCVLHCEGTFETDKIDTVWA